MNSYIAYGLVGLIWLIGAALTYSRAEGEGRNGSLWGLFALVAGPIAWIACAVTADREPQYSGPVIDTAETVGASALHMGFTREATRPETDLASKASADLRDPYIERLIDRGKLKEAKEALYGLLQTAKDAHDLPMIATYEGYAQRIRHQELASVERNAPMPVAGPPSDFVDNTDMLHHAAKADVVGNEEHQTLL
ncbi:MAG: hypothetical protein GEEBNDBF_02592 [bacterium]|nr:hypothetical protein [bacterium]